MPTLSEFDLTLQLRYDEAEDMTYTVFRFETVRQFRSFQYEIEVDSDFDAQAHAIDLKIKGVRAPSLMMPSTGAAYTELTFPRLKGDYDVRISGAKQQGEFRMKVTPKKITLTDVDELNFVHIKVEDDLDVIPA